MVKQTILIVLILLGVVSLAPRPAVSLAGDAPMPTAFEVLLQATRNLEAVFEGTATRDGDTYSLYDGHLSTMFRDDDFNGGSIFLKTNQIAAGYTTITNEVIGNVYGYDSLVTTTLNNPIAPESINIVVVSGDEATDDGNGVLASPKKNENTKGVLLMPGAGPYDLQWGNIVPGTVRVYTTNFYPQGADYNLYYDDGDGNLIDSVTDDPWAMIDYVSGVVTKLDSGASLPYRAYATFEYRQIYGTVNYETGKVSITFYTPRTGSVYADYQYGYATFIPLILNVTDFTSSTGRIQFETDVLNVGTSKGDQYGVMTKRYPAYVLRQKLNETLREIRAEAEYTVSDGGVPPAYVYPDCGDLSNGELTWTDARKIVRIELGRSDTADRQWRPVTRWTLNGTTLRFNDPEMPDTSDYVLRITVSDSLAEVSSDSAEISDRYPLDWLGLEVALKCARWRLFQAGKDDKQLTILINDLMARRDKARSRARFIEPHPLTFQNAQEWPEC